MVKQCPKCKEDKSFDEYHKSSSTKDGLQGYCKPCNKANNNNSYREKDARKHFPTPFDIGVYAIKEGKEVVYIGSSDNLPFRLYKHFALNGTFDDGLNKLQRKFRYTWHVMWHGDSLEDARHQEKALIQIHNPRFNKIKYKLYAA